MALATLSIDLVAKLAKLESGLAQATRIAEKNAAQISAAFAKTDAVIGKIGGNLRNMFAGITVGALIKGIVSSLDALVDLRDATGATIENLSALEDVALTTGTSFDKMSSILIKFNKGLNDAKPGDDIDRTLKAIGLSTEQLKALDPAEALRQVAVAFSKFADDGSKARAMQELFGKSIAEAAPLMNELAAKTQLTATVTTKAAKEAENLANNFHKITKAVLDSAREMAGPLNTALQATLDLITKINQWRDKRFAEGDAKIEEDRVKRLAQVNRELAKSNLSVYARVNLERELLQLQQKAPAFKSEVEREMSVLSRARPDDRPQIKVQTKASDDAAKKSATDIAALIQRYKELFEAEMAVDSSETEIAKARIALSDPKYARATEAEKQAILDYAAGIHTWKLRREEANAAIAEALQHDKLLGEQMAALTRETEKQNAAFEALKESLPSSELEALVAKEDDLRKRFEKGQISAEKYAEALNKIYGINPDPTVKSIDSIGLAVQDLASEIDQAFGAGLQGLLEGNFKSIGDAFKRMIEGMIIKATQAELMEKLFGASTSGGGRAGGGLIDIGLKLLGSIGTGNVDSGAIVAAGEEMGGFPGLVNTAAPSSVVTINYDIASGVTRNELAALMPTIQQQTTSAVLSTMRRPGFSGG